MNIRYRQLTAIILAGTSVALGAFGAHALKDILSAHYLEVWETATRYQIIHAVALLILCEHQQRSPSRLLSGAFRALLAGTVLFSGSLYVLCLSEYKMAGLITPIGGVSLLTGWLLWATAIMKRER